MPKPIKSAGVGRRMRLFGYLGPFPGKRHEVMRKGQHTVPIPNPHRADVDWTLTKRILKQAAIDPKQWGEID